MSERSLASSPESKLGVLLGGLNGAVATTFAAGLFAVREHRAQPVGSLTQMARISTNSTNGDSGNTSPIKEVVPLAELDDVIIGGWDIQDTDCFRAATKANVLSERDLSGVRRQLETLRPMKAVFDPAYAPRLRGTWTKSAPTKFELMEQLRDDIRSFRREHGLERVVMIWCASTETHVLEHAVHRDPDRMIAAMKANDPFISPSMLYAYAAILEGLPYVNCTPNRVTDLPALSLLAQQQEVPIAGKDLKTGQTLVKTVVAPMLKARMLGVKGWFSTNLLGNQDGEVLDEPRCFKAKEESKLCSLECILQPELYPLLYENLCHKVTINYYPPRGDDKEGWDNIDIYGWMGYPMQLKINFLCRDSILAAPLVLDLTLLMDLAHRGDRSGIQDWLSFYFKSPLHAPGRPAVHDLFLQLHNLEQTLAAVAGQRMAAVAADLEL